MDDLDRLALAAAREIVQVDDTDRQRNADTDSLTTFETARKVLAMLDERTGPHSEP